MASFGSSPSSAAECRRCDVRRRRRAIGQEVVGEGGQAGRPGRAADDDEPAAAGDPAAHRLELVGRRAGRIDVLPDEPVEDAPRLDPVRAGRPTSRPTVRGATLFMVGQQVEVADDVAGSLRRRCRRRAGSRRGSANAALVVAIVVVARDQADLELAPEAPVAGRRAGASCRDWVGSSTGVPKRVRPWVPPVSRSSPSIGGPSFLRRTSIAIHDPTRAWPSRRTVASIVRPGGGVTAATARPPASTARRAPSDAARPPRGRAGTRVADGPLELDDARGLRAGGQVGDRSKDA